MASRQDGKKRQAWESRLKRCRTSGLTVAQFCQREGVSVNTFYYWAKRIEAAATTPPLPQSGTPAWRNRRSRKCVPVAEGISNVAVVRFHWKGEVEVLVPADCLDAIGCLAARLPQSRPEPAEAFQEVLVTR